MSGFSGSPRLVRGGLVLLHPQSGAVQRIVALQYNPDTLTRSFQVRGVGNDSGDHLEALRLKGPPVETIKLDAEIDATDALAGGDSQTAQAGLHPLLAALETMVYPSSAHLAAVHAEARSGTLEIAPAMAPLAVFVFGPKRIVPVRLTELSVTEEAFDPQLNPLRAKLGLSLRVLTVDDLGFDARGGGLFMTYLQAKEQLAASHAGAAFSTLGIRGLP
jgi:hypothetical protein